MIINLIAGALGGIAIPMLLDSLDIDPAISSGAFVTTVTDVVGSSPSWDSPRSGSDSLMAGFVRFALSFSHETLERACICHVFHLDTPAITSILHGEDEPHGARHR